MIDMIELSKNSIKNHKATFVICVTLFIIGVLNLFINYKMCRFFHPWNIVIEFIPFIISIIIFNKFNKKQMKVEVKGAIITTLILTSLVLLIFNFGYLVVDETFNTNSKIKNYSRTLRLYSGNDGVDHFPIVIPKDAQNVSFQEWPAFMQGSSVIHLSYDIDEGDIEKIDEEFRNKSKYVFRNIEEIKSFGERIDLIWQIREAIGNDGISEICDNFTIYMIGAEKFSGDGYWNHGIEYGIVINKDTMRIVYFYQRW